MANDNDDELHYTFSSMKETLMMIIIWWNVTREATTSVGITNDSELMM